MIRNEADILPYWLKYYSGLFGVENIAIIDNVSDDPVTLKILDEWRDLGLTVIKYDGQFYQKGDVIADLFHKRFPYAKIAIPVDADEFLMPYVDGKPTPNKRMTFSILQSFYASKVGCLSLEQNYLSYNFHFNDTVGNITSFRPNIIRDIDLSKKIALLDRLKSFQQGFHLVELNDGRGNCSSGFDKLGILHFHNRNPYVTAQRAINDIVGFGYIDRSKMSLQNVGKHKALLERWLKKGKVAAHHKMEELILYINYGPQGLLNDPNVAKDIVHVESIDKIIQQYKQQPILNT